MATFNATSILIDAFLDELESAQRRMYPGLPRDYAGVIRAAGTMAMEIIANTSAFYHNTEHSMMVTLVGQEILYGKFLREGSVATRATGCTSWSRCCATTSATCAASVRATTATWR